MSSPVPHIVIDAPYRSDVVASPAPEIGWRTDTDAPGWLQASADVEITRGAEASQHRIEGRMSTRVAWPFAPLAPREEATLRVRVTGEDGVTGPWSAPRRVFAGFLGEGEWQATAIGLASPSQTAQPVCLRAEFDVTGPVARATLYATAVGVYQVAIDGTDVDDQVMKPGWTPYQHRTIHETTDVTALLAEGRNAIGVRLAGAWATERYGFRENARPLYAEQPRFAGQLLIEYADGSSEWVTTDASWQASTGPITASGLYAGEDHDARRALVDADGRGFAQAGYDASAWSPAAELEAIRTPEARVSPFVRRLDELTVQEVITTPSGRTVLDFGQNLVGRLRIRVEGPAGTEISCATPKCSSTASWARARCARRRPPTTTRWQAPAWRSGSPSSPSTGSATPRSTAGRATSTRPR